MCGLVGRLEFSGQPVDADRLARACDALAQRGPDDQGLWIDGPIGLAHRRLSILDLSPRGHQPMHLAAGGLSIVFNGEIYNFRDVRETLAASGHRFESDGDTEVILAAWRQWGPACLPRLNGMFAFALWDARERRLWLARDRLGVKPLCYRLDRDRIAFGSTADALAAFGDLPLSASPEAARLYLDLGYLPGEVSAWAEVHRLGAGCLMCVESGGRSRIERWWRLAGAPAGEGSSEPTPRVPGDEAGALDALEAQIAASVERRLVSDVPVGAFLSGGIDSSLVVALMRSAGGTVRTYTIGFDDPRYDESIHARAVAQHLGVHNTHERIGPGDLLDTLDTLTARYDEPFADSSAIPTLLLARLARREVTVALSGDGGDELFGGYPYHRIVEQLAPWHASLRPLARLARSLVGVRAGHRAALALQALAAPDLASMYAGFRSPLRLLDQPLFPGDARPAGRWMREHAMPGIAEHSADGARRPVAERMMDLDLLTYLESDILVKVDRATMAFGLEARNPFLDWRVVRCAHALPRSLRSNPAGGKRALRQLLARHLPASLIDRPKAGFVVPIREWLRGPLRDPFRAAIADGFLCREGWIDRRVALRAFDDHAAGRAHHEHLLWALAMYERWHASRARPLAATH
ncbi:MAG: asparagine synthase (glutamine-hydrolyzing) [Pseudomonadota bacterium]